LNDGLEGWMTATAKSLPKQISTLRPETRKRNKFNNVRSNDSLLPATRTPVYYDFSDKILQFYDKIDLGYFGQSENGLLTLD
jgi:hypothetical protein